MDILTYNGGIMNNIKLISDSSCDFTAQEIEKYDLQIIPFSCTFDDITYLRENIDITKEEFYDKLKDPNVFAKTSLPSVNSYLEAFEAAVKDGKGIICFTISSKFSGSYQSAVNAKNILLEDYPDAKVEVIDTMNVTVAQGSLIKFAHKLIQDGKTLSETTEIVLKNRERVCLVLTTSTLKYLVKGGRIGKMQGFAGELLNISPIIVMADGELNNVTKVRGQKKAHATLIDYAKDFAKKFNYDIQKSDTYVFRCVEDIEPLKQKALDEGFTDITTGFVGVTITAHIGTSVYALCVTCFEE